MGAHVRGRGVELAPRRDPRCGRGYDLRKPRVLSVAASLAGRGMEGKAAEANAILKEITVNQFLTAADKQRDARPSRLEQKDPNVSLDLGRSGLGGSASEIVGSGVSGSAVYRDRRGSHLDTRAHHLLREPSTEHPGREDHRYRASGCPGAHAFHAAPAMD